MRPSRARLLLVDESESMRGIACAILREAGFTTIRDTSDGSALLRWDGRAQFDVVVTPFDLVIAGRRHSSTSLAPALVEHVLQLLAVLAEEEGMR